MIAALPSHDLFSCPQCSAFECCAQANMELTARFLTDAASRSQAAAMACESLLDMLRQQRIALVVAAGPKIPFDCGD